MNEQEFELEWEKATAQHLKPEIRLNNSTLLYPDAYKEEVLENGWIVIIFYNKQDVIAMSYLEDIEGLSIRESE